MEVPDNSDSARSNENDSDRGGVRNYTPPSPEKLRQEQEEFRRQAKEEEDKNRLDYCINYGNSSATAREFCALGALGDD